MTQSMIKEERATHTPPEIQPRYASTEGIQITDGGRDRRQPGELRRELMEQNYTQVETILQLADASNRYRETTEYRFIINGIVRPWDRDSQIPGRESGPAEWVDGWVGHVVSAALTLRQCGSPAYLLSFLLFQLLFLYLSVPSSISFSFSFFLFFLLFFLLVLFLLFFSSSSSFLLFLLLMHCIPTKTFLTHVITASPLLSSLYKLH